MELRNETGYPGEAERGRSPSGASPGYPGVPAGERYPEDPRESGEDDGGPEDTRAVSDATEYPGGPESPSSEPIVADHECLPGLPRLRGRSSRNRSLRKPEAGRDSYTPEERLLLLDTWRRSGLPTGDFAALVGLSKHTLYAWKQRFERLGPGGLMDQQRGGPRGSRLPDLTRRTILMLKQSNPEAGCQRISDMLLRGPALPASPAAVARVLHEAGYTLSEEPTKPHPDKPREFERARANELWQTDIFTFVLKRQNRRVYLVAFLDDHSRFIVSYGLGASPTSAWVIAVFRAGVASFQAPREVLTDNGPQYVTWRGRSAFSRELERQGIRHIVARPRRPQTLGKTERMWGSLWRECVERAVFLDLADAQRRIGWYFDAYNFARPHQGIGGLTPADRFFSAAPEVLRTLKARAAGNAMELARHGVPRSPFYLTGSAGGKLFSVHAEGERVILSRGEGVRQEVELTPPAEGEGAGRETLPKLDPIPGPLCPSAEPSLADDVPPPAPGVSAIDALSAQEAGSLGSEGSSVPRTEAELGFEDEIDLDALDPREEGGERHDDGDCIH